MARIKCCGEEELLQWRKKKSVAVEKRKNVVVGRRKTAPRCTDEIYDEEKNK